MDLKISNFGRAFKNMETRLGRQQDILNKLEERIDEEAEKNVESDRQINAAVDRITSLLDQKVPPALIPQTMQRARRPRRCMWVPRRRAEMLMGVVLRVRGVGNRRGTGGTAEADV
jgi:hypothetical protein